MSDQLTNTKRAIGNVIVPVALTALVVGGQEPTWELGLHSFAATVGKVEVVNNAVNLDGSNTFSLPNGVLGDQSDYTIEFEVVRLKSEHEDNDNFDIVSNMDDEKESGLAFGPVWYPTGWRATSLSINGHRTVTQRAFKVGTPVTVTMTAQDGQLMLFLDGLLLSMTEAVTPSARPLTFGEISDKPIIPYKLSKLRIFNQAVTPSGYDPSTDMMRTFSGDGYSMQRVDIDDPTLPRILVIGDSISMGYRRYITERFKGKAYVDYWISPLMFKLQPDDVEPVNKAWSGVLGNGPYDVVTWNHATLHMWDPARPERCSYDTYPDAMRKVVRHILDASPETRFYWVNCTPIVRDGSLETDENQRLVRFNHLTQPIMKDYDIPIIDLYDVCAKNLAMVSSDGVHWSAEAYQLMADAIAESITPHVADKK